MKFIENTLKDTPGKRAVELEKDKVRKRSVDI